MTTILTVSVNDWIFEAIEAKKKAENKGRSETVNELLCKALLRIDPAINK